MALFESYERRIDKINAVLNSYGIASLEEAEKITKDAGLDVYNQIKVRPFTDSLCLKKLVFTFKIRHLFFHFLFNGLRCLQDPLHWNNIMRCRVQSNRLWIF